MRKIVISGMIGNALEWYDFALYGHFALIISKLYFPLEDNYLSMIITFSVFAAGFIMRPVGGLLFGYIGDRYGRKSSLILSILSMAIPTACIGLLPTYEQIGITAPILLLIIRLLQGLSLGGGFSGCIAFIVEHAPDKQRGLYGSSSIFSMCAGILLGLIVANIFSYSLEPESFETWGWRIPFLISFIIGLVAIYIKDNLQESPKYLAAKANKAISVRPLRELLTNYRAKLLIAIGIYLTVTVPFYTLMIFMNSLMTKYLAYSTNDAILINSISIIIHMILLPLAAFFSDKFGRKTILSIAIYAFILLCLPIFYLLNNSNFIYPLIAQILFAIALAFYIAPVPALLVELFPTRIRLTGIALSYNISAAIFGGTTPAVATWLLKVTDNIYSLAFYIVSFAILSLISLSYFKDKFDQPLN